MATSILRRGSSLAASGTSSIASSSRLISKVASKQDAKKRLAYLTAQSYKPSIDTPTQFIDAIAKPRRGDLSSISTLLGEKPSWTSFDDLNRDKLKKGGVTIKERKYFLWAKEKFKQGEHPSIFAIDMKPKKVVRGWGPRVQKGIRVRGRVRAGER